LVVCVDHGSRGHQVVGLDERFAGLGKVVFGRRHRRRRRGEQKPRVNFKIFNQINLNLNNGF